MKRTPLPAKRRCTALTTSTTGPQVRLSQNFGVAKTSTNGTCARQRVGDGVAEQRQVGRARRRQGRDVAVGALERRRARRDRAVADGRSLRTPIDLRLRDALDRGALRLGDERVLAGLVEPEAGDVDRPRAAGRGLRASRDPDRLELRDRRDDRRRIERRADPARARAAGGSARLAVDHEEGDPELARPRSPTCPGRARRPGPGRASKRVERPGRSGSLASLRRRNRTRSSATRRREAAARRTHARV